MPANRRIFPTLIATYGRTLYALVIGLICGCGACDAVGFGIIRGHTMNVKTKQERLGCGVRRGHDDAKLCDDHTILCTLSYLSLLNYDTFSKGNIEPHLPSDQEWDAKSTSVAWSKEFWHTV